MGVSIPANNPIAVLPADQMNGRSISWGEAGRVIRTKGRVAIFLFLLAWGNGMSASEGGPVRYLAFQIFTGGFDSAEMRAGIPPLNGDCLKIVADLRDAIGTPGTNGRKLGFILGPIAFDTPDENVRALIRNAFVVALQTGVAAGFHLDDSMFWGRLEELDAIENVEWSDWNRTPNTGRRLDWSEKPLKIRPQLCFNSPAVLSAVARRAALVGEEVARGIQRLRAAHREDLFLGVIAGWETQIGRDFDTGKSLGYGALSHAGFSAARPPADRAVALGKIVEDFIGYWAQALGKSGVPGDKIYSHVAFMSEDLYQLAARMNPARGSAPYRQAINFTPPETAFATSCIPGFSTYPQPGHLEQLQAELKRHGNPPWASCEGTALDPGEAGHGGRGTNMEGYLGNLFNHGAVLVNIFGWGVGDRDNPFRRVAEGDGALLAYRKFLRGEELAEAPLPRPTLPPADLPGKIHRIQSALPAWVREHDPIRIRPLLEKLDGALKRQQFNEAAQAADEILGLIASPPPTK
jgi:hypothetical protein